MVDRISQDFACRKRAKFCTSKAELSRSMIVAQDVISAFVAKLVGFVRSYYARRDFPNNDPGDRLALAR